MNRAQRDEASERQVQAADPMTSTWLSANAGSGKTRVLTDRVARLLLAEVAPQSILCLTYTKAAAAEMQNRLFQRLGEWAMMDDTDLKTQLFELGVEQSLTDTFLDSARRLFARAIETPGGLKIQTIHSFCAALLRRFPLEAGVSPAFSEMDERATDALLQQVLDEFALTEPKVFEACAAYVTASDMSALVGEIARNSDAFSEARQWEDIVAWMGLPSGANKDSIASSVFLGSEQSLIDDLVPIMTTGTVTDQKIGQKLADIPPLGFEVLPYLEDVFLTKSGAAPFTAKLGKLPTKKTQARIPDLIEPLEQFMVRVEQARQHRLMLAAAQKTAALYRFAEHYIPLYQARKTALGLLDFDDLILKARNLLRQPGLSEWVLYKLDGGIDHVLVDEAQDTSPLQWEVIRLLTQDFASGESARSDVERTIFVVGDKKQSIYSFQGADPDGFDRMNYDFGQRLLRSDRPLVTLQLEYSFRSSEAVLRLVDTVFQGNEGSLGLVKHRAFKSTMPGRVDVWPLIEAPEKSAADNWEDPVDLIGENHHHRLLAERIATNIRRMIDTEVLWTIEKDGTKTARPITEGDVLILVQSRSTLFHEIIRACKMANLEIAGADRLKLGGELAVRDIMATLSFLATPEDSLSLATALRSPLFGWSEEALHRLAANRDETHLWRTLQKHKETYSETVFILESLRNAADFLRPYDLIDRLLLRYDGRRNLVARLRQEAEDGIDAVLNQALAYEQTEPPSLTGFLSWMEQGDAVIKRQPDTASGKLRVMTVHGAKGLEAPIVILPDTADKADTIKSDLLVDPDGTIAWKTTSAETPDRLLTVTDHIKAKQAQERQRLLYVAMTRAEQWLIVGASGKVSDARESWFSQISNAMEKVGAVDIDIDGETGKRFEPLEWPAADVDRTRNTVDRETSLPDWVETPVPAPERQKKPLTPSDLGGAKAIGAEQDGWDGEDAKRRGSMIHLLLEHLPHMDAADRPMQARTILEIGGYSLFDGELEPLLDETLRVIESPSLASVFASDSLAEVDFTGFLPATNLPLTGIIDRLIVANDHVLVVDFKSNRVVPSKPAQTPLGLLRQMGAYAHAAQQIFPDKRIETAILWTNTATLMTLPHGLVSEAFLSM